MGFFNDSKPKKTEYEKYQEYLTNHIDYDGKTILILRGTIEWKYVDELVDKGYQILGYGKDAWGSYHELILKKPITKNGESDQRWKMIYCLYKSDML